MTLSDCQRFQRLRLTTSEDFSTAGYAYKGRLAALILTALLSDVPYVARRRTRNVSAPTS
jgi:hypothetical protein